MLRFINPEVSYHPPNSKSNFIAGVAINMADFICKLDEYKISHPPSHVLRKSLDKRSLTSGKQHFLPHSAVEGAHILTEEKRQHVGLLYVSLSREKFFTYFTQSIG